MPPSIVKSTVVTGLIRMGAGKENDAEVLTDLQGCNLVSSFWDLGHAIVTGPRFLVQVL